MSDWPRTSKPYGSGMMVISLASPLSCGPSAAHLATNANNASTAWPAANRVLLIPFRLPCPMTAYKIVAGCGATAGGNFDVGIYDKFGNRLVSQGSTARSASSEVVCNITDTLLLPGTYYLALQGDGTNTYAGNTAAQAAQVKAIGIYQASPGSFPLPSTLTFETAAGTFIPTGVALYLTSK